MEDLHTCMSEEFQIYGTSDMKFPKDFHSLKMTHTGLDISVLFFTLDSVVFCQTGQTKICGEVILKRFVIETYPLKDIMVI